MHAAHEKIGEIICSAKMNKLTDNELECLAYMMQAAETTVQEVAKRATGRK